MSSEDSARVEEVRQRILVPALDDQQYLRLLHEIIEFVEMMSTSMPAEPIRQFQQTVIPELIEKFNQIEPQFYDSVRHKIRRQTLEILQMTPFPDNHALMSFEKIVQLLMNVLNNDNEENAEFAIKMLLEIQKYYKTSWDIMESDRNSSQIFINYCKAIISNLPNKLERCKQPEESKSTSEDQRVPLNGSKDSIKTIPLITHYFLFMNQLFDQNYKQQILQIIESMKLAIEKFPDSILPEVKNMGLYIEYLETIRNILSFFTFILRRNFTEEVINIIDIIMGVQIRILKNTPQHGLNIRKDILHMIKYEITEINTMERADLAAKNRSRDQLYHKRNLCFQRHISDLLNYNIIYGKGKLNKDLQFHTKSLVFTFISQNREQMNAEQTKKAFHIIFKNLLDPTVTLNMKNTLIYILYKKHEENMKAQGPGGANQEQLMEILQCLIHLFKDLNAQFEVTVEEMAKFKQEIITLRNNNIKWMNDQEQKNAPFKDLLFSEDYSFAEIGQDEELNLFKIQQQFYFHHLFEQTGSYTQSQQDITKQRNKYYPYISMTDTQINEYIEAQKEMCLKLVKNLVSFIDTILLQIQESRNARFLQLEEMKLMRKLLIHGSNVIQHLYDLQQEKDKVHDVLKRFARLFQQMQILEFRDLFQSVEDEFFGRVIEIKATKGDTGIFLLAEYLMSFQSAHQANPSMVNRAQDDQTAYILEIFFNYVHKKMRIFNKAMEKEQLLTLNIVDSRFSKIQTPDLQDTMQKLTLLIGEKALSKKNDLRMKNLFFSVFVFCIKYTKASKIVPYYFMVIRNLFKVLCNLSDNSNFVKEFIPMIQGLLETFLQAKEEAAFIKETNEICYSVPAKLKNLIEYLPIISRPLIDSMKSNSIELIESGINSIQMWVSALASYPEILDPVIENILPELNSLLYKILYLLPNYTFKLLGKLGAKSRLYYEDKEFKSKNYPEDGLKIDLIDKHSGKQVVLGIDSAIDVVLLKIFDSFHKYSQQKLLEAYKLVKSSFVCFIEPEVDIDYLIASIINAKTKNTDLLTYFDSKKTQIKISALGRGSESHAFEKILKCLLIACSLPKNNPETQAVHEKVKKFFKWVTQYFTLIYICKNGKLKENLVNEISPLVFIENICDFLYFNMIQGLPKSQQRSYFKGSVTALKTMIRMVKTIYGDDEPEIYENLEFIQILIQKICHLSYGQDLPKKVAANIALQIIIKELPARTIKYHYVSFMDSLFHILNTNYETLVYQVEKECKTTLDKFFEKVGIYSRELAESVDEKDQEFYNAIMDRVLQQLYQNKLSARTMSMYFVEQISKKSGISIPLILQRVNRLQTHPNEQDKSWYTFFLTQQIEMKAKSLFTMFKGGYSQVLNLISYLDLLQYLIKHKVIEPINKVHVYLVICEQMLKILEDEVDKAENRNDSLPSFNNDIMISSAAKSAVKYMKLEKYYISQNKVYDPYSHTLHPHHFLQNQHFEVEELAKRDKFLQEIDSVQYSYNHFDIFVQRQPTLDINPKAMEQLKQEEIDEFKKTLHQRIQDFIQKMFSNGIKASDISFEYVNHLYELYPNHRLHTELITKILTVLCDISTEDKMHLYFKEKQQVFFEQSQQQYPGQQQPAAQSQAANLTKRLDLYAVEIKSKIIAVYFKFFQREEHNINKAAKKCLSRLLKKETNQQEALPNQILKECVRPSLNILSQRTQFPALYKQLTRLIYVLHGCFNEQLGRHLIRCYEINKNKVLDEFQLSMKNNLQESNQNPDHPMANDAELTQEDKQRKFQEDYERLIVQQNAKIEDLEIAHHIIKILYLLPTSRQEIQRILVQIPAFEIQVLQELERKFEEAYKGLQDHYQIQHFYQHEQTVRPLSVRLGLLKSDLREGLSKFYNKNPFEALDTFKPNGSLIPVMLQILREPNSYCLRERVSREPELIKQQFLQQGVETQEFDVGMRLIGTFIKYNSNYLTLPHNQGIVDCLRKKWIQLAETNLDDMLQKFNNQAQIRRNYQKIQKYLISYCRSSKAKIQVLFELIKGFRYQGFIDMSPTKIFFQFEIPYKFSVKKKRELLSIILQKISYGQNPASGTGVDEYKFMIFELGFMPCILKHAESEPVFKEVFDEKSVAEFMEAFFGMSLQQASGQGSTQKICRIDELKQNLETSQLVSYEQFQIEIIKVLNLIFRYFDFYTIQNSCPKKEITKLNQFLYSCSKKSYNPTLKEWAFYTLTSLFIRILQHIPPDAEALISMISQTSEQLLMLILQHGTNLSQKSLVHKSFRNLLDILTNPGVSPRLPRENENYDFVSICLKRALIFEGRVNQQVQYLSSFILANPDIFYRSHQIFINRISRIISRFGAQLQPNLSQKQMVVELSAVLIEWFKRRVVEQRVTEEQHQTLQLTCTNILFYLIRTSVMLQFSQNESMKEVIDLSNLCLKQIKRLVHYFPNVRIQFPLFNRLINNEGGDRDNLQIIKMALLNVSNILIKYQRQGHEFKSFFLDYIVTANTKYQKGILFSCKILNEIILNNQDTEFQKITNDKIKKLLETDLQKSQDENITDMQNKIRQLEEKYNSERKQSVLSFQEQAQIISAAIPHFTIRLIDSLDKAQKKLGINIRQQGFKYADDEFKFYKNLATSIFRVVGYFRKQLIFDQMDVGPQRVRVKHNVVHQVVNASTQYTPDDLITQQDDIAELKIEESNHDLFNKESIMMGILLVMKKLKKMSQEDSIQIFEIVQYTIQSLIKYNTNEYIIEWLRKIVDALIDDEEDDISKLLMEQKANYVAKILAKITELQTPDKKEQTHTNQLVDRIFEQSVRFLEKQTSLMQEYTLRLFEKVFIHSKGKSVKLKQRLFTVFERLNGASLYKKLQYFFSKHQLDDSEKLAFFQSQSQLLDFTLFNFKSNVPLKKTQYSSRLFPLYNINIMFENKLNLENRNDQGNSEYLKVQGLLGHFATKIKKYSGMQLSSLMDPLSEIISINPSHSTDKLISDKLFIKLFWQYWNLLSRDDQQVMSDSINHFFLTTIPMINNQEFRKHSFPKTFLESVAALSPQIRMEPEVLQLLGKHLNLWHVTIPMLENHITLYPSNERYIFSLNELYSKLYEEDQIAGLRRMITDSNETRSIISYGQHQMWEEINQQFSHYIIYYAEQEGLYAQMDREYNMPGKYQRQIPHPTFQKLQQNHEEQMKGKYEAEKQANPDMPDQNTYLQKEQERLLRQINDVSNHNANLSYPRVGPNNNVKEVDLRIWETLFIESLKVLNKWDQYRDIAHALNNQEMMIEYLWNVKDWRALQQYEGILKKSESIKYQLYYIYLIIYQQQINQFDDIFKQVIQLSYKEWDQCLPNYVDNVQFENLIMFQLVMESSEGGRNMIKEAQNLKMRGRLADLKTAINIWRERVPHQCESIQMWKEVLENRNFIQDQISHIIAPVQSLAQVPQDQQQSQRQQQDQQRQQFANEFLDKAWNYYKLAYVSRKQGLPSLAYFYANMMRGQTSVSQDSEGTRYERFKCDSEYLKLQLEYNNNPKSLSTLVDEFSNMVNQRYISAQGPLVFENWQTAEMCRLLGEYFLRVGKLDQSQKYIALSIENNKKEAKTWISYAKLNQTVFQSRRDELSVQNILKGYFSAIVLNLHKSRLIIPQILKLLKRRDYNNAQFTSLIAYLKTNLDQMPTWIWIFWIPQILQVFFQNHNQIETNFSRIVLEKICKLYPQTIYYQLKMKQQYFTDEAINQQLTPVINNLMQHIKRSGYHSVLLLDRISSEFVKNLKSTTEEELHIVLSKILCMSQFFKIDQFERDFSSFLNQLNTRFFNDQSIQNSVLMSELKPKFDQDFINEDTKERDIIEIIKRLKNLKDFLHKKLSLAEQKTNLEQISQYLANFNEKGVELPGQFMILDTEPVPQNTIYIQKFEPVVYRGGVTSKKIVIKCSNQKIYAFTIAMIQGKEDYGKFCSEERVLQIKMIMNQIFKKHKETLRRGIKFYVPIKVLMQRSKLSQDDLPFANLQEIHDYLFQERGLDSDLALNLQIQKVENIFKEYEQDQEKTISSISPERKQQINEETFDEMKSIYCQPYLLSSFFHRIFYNVDDLFIFKKQFTTYHAVNSYFAYIFNQVEYFTLGQISFCKTSGRLNFNDAKLLEFIKNKNLKKYIQSADFEALEHEDIYDQSAKSYLPFRLTPNIVDFMGKIGLQGLFAGAMTSCSLAMQKHHEKLIPLLQLVYRDDLNNDSDQTLLYINHCCEYIRYKMLNLSQNKNVLNLENVPPQANPEQPQEDFVQFGNIKVPKEYLKYEMERPNIMEEFNRKVFEIIDVAQDEKRLSQMPSNWNAWF